ncbi:MAG: SRPBCC family protein [Dermatophilaceae bacterium]|nr:SRPBCC family protein [Intrasporangiaceae bacterium]
MRLTTHVTGPASVELAWERYADPALWSTWAPQIRTVRIHEGDPGRIHVGMRGTVHALFGLSVRFEVTDVDEAARTWWWTVHPPGLTLHLGHTIEPRPDGRTRTGLIIDGPAPVVLTYAPVARLALHRLLAVDRVDSA